MAKSQADILKGFGRTGWTVTATRPETTTIMVDDPSSPTGTRPYEQPTGNIIWGITSPTTGQYDEVVVAPSKIESGDVWTTGPVFDPVRGPKEEIKAPSAESTEAGSPQLAAQRAAEAAAAQALADQRKAEDAQRAANKQATGFALSDKERADLASTAASQNLTQQQINQRAAELEQSGAQKNRELDIAAANNQIAGANQALAAKRLELDGIVREDASKLDWAKFEYLKAKDASDNQIAQARVDLERLSQQQSNAIAQQTLQQRKDEAAATAAQNAALLQQRKDEATQTADTAAQTAAVTAASSILSNERQAQSQAAQTAAGLLQQRTATAGSMLGNILDVATRRPLYAGVPEGIGPQLLSDIGGWTAQLMGGQETLDAAANLVHAANPQNAGSPQAAAATAVLAQMLARYQADNGRPHPAAVTAASAPAQAPSMTGGAVAPQPVPQPYAQSGLPEGRGVSFQAPSAVAPVNQVPGQNYGASTAYNGGVPPWNVQAPAAQSFVAPVMAPAPVAAPAPTININMTGGGQAQPQPVPPRPNYLALAGAGG